MRTKALLILAFVLLVATTGCDKITFQTHKDGGGDGALTQDELCDSNEGMDFSFEKSQPPGEVDTGDSIYISFSLANKGCSDTEGALLQMTGLDTEKIVLTQYYFDNINMKGKSQTNPWGDILTLSTDGIIIGADPAKKIDAVNMYAFLCYPYTTTASADICISPRKDTPVELAPESCKHGNVRLDPTQGGPVVVHNVETRLIDSNYGRKMQLNIYLKNRGNGKVVPATQGQCFGDALVTLEEVAFGDYSLSTEGANRITCGRGEGPVTIKLSEDSNNMIKCIVDLYETGPSYTSPLYMRISYGYRLTKQQRIAINNLNYQGEEVEREPEE
ncbi:MAG: hypothetical protein ABIC95_05795 [archaeon]